MNTPTRRIRNVENVERQFLQSLPTFGPASQRWAAIIGAVIQLATDVRTVDEWAHAIGRSRGTIKCWCAAARITARESLLFARMLRAVVRYSGKPWNIQDILDVVDPRTLNRILCRAGLERQPASPPDIASFLEAQRFVTAPALLAAVRERLAQLRAIDRC